MKRIGLIWWILLFPFLTAPGQEKPFRVLCLLTEFEDVRFTLEDPAAYFDALLNEEGFSQVGGTGSVKDYYRDNSGGIFVPEFTVRGPVLLPEKVQTYGNNIYDAGIRLGDIAPDKLLPDALALLEEEGEYDAYYVIYAGYDESQGGPKETLWAHQGVSENGLQYACSAELMGSGGNLSSGIGPICHEMGHLLGLPDFYDTNASEDGTAVGPAMYSLMGTGSQNSEGRRPPYMNALERMLLGWPVRIATLPEGRLEMDPFPEGMVYRSETEMEGEYFLYECRGGNGWDSGLPGGLLIYHIDQTDKARWEAWKEDNTLNAIAAHPCFYPIRSSAPALSLLAIASTEGSNLVFPGLSRTLCHEPVDWAGNYTGIQITNIEWDGKKTSLYVLKGHGANINGLVKDAGGRPLQGVIVTGEGLEGYVVSDEGGFFCLSIPEPQQVFTLTATMADCRPAQVEVSCNGERMASASIVLHRQGEADESTLSKYDHLATFGYFPQAQVGAVRYSPQELAPYVGRIFSEISFYPYLEPSFEGEVFVTVDIGSQRVLERKVEGLSCGHFYRNTVDISDAGIVVPEGEYVYIGTGSREAGEGFYLGTVYPSISTSSFYQDAENAPWKPIFVQKAGFYMDVALSTSVKEMTHPSDPGQLGYLYIQNSEVYRKGESFELKLGGAVPEDAEVSWFLDGSPVGGTILPEAGEHLIEAIIQYGPSRREKISLKINVL